MMNMFQLQERLQDFSKEQLAQEMQRPSGNAPQYLVLAEMQRRKRMESAAAMEQGQQNETTVAQDAVAAAGVPQQGLGGMMQAMAPKTDVTMNTGQTPVQQMYGGGVIKAQEGAFMRSEGFGENVEYNYDTFLREMGLQDSPDVRDAFRRYQDRMNAQNALEGPNTDPGLFMPFLDEAPQSLPSLSDVSADVGSFSAMADAAPARSAVPSLPALPDADRPPLFDRTTPPQPARQGYIPPNIGATELNTPAIRNALDIPGLSDYDLIGENVNPRFPPNPNVRLPDSRRPMAPWDISEAEPDRGGYVPPTMGATELNTPAMRTALGADEPSPWTIDPANTDGSLWGDILPDIGNTATLLSPFASEEEQMAAAGSLGAMDTGTPLEIPDAGIESLLPPSPANNAPVTPTGGSGSGSGSGGSNLGGSGKAVMSDLEKAFEQDKWLSLAKFGLGLMSSKQSTFGGAIGESGLGAIADFQQARKSYEENTMARQLMNAKLAAASRSGGGGKPISSSIITTLGDQLAALENEYASIPEPETGWFGGTTDDYAGDRMRLGEEVQIKRAQLNYALSSNGVPMPSTPSLGAVRANISDPSK